MALQEVIGTEPRAARPPRPGCRAEALRALELVLPGPLAAAATGRVARALDDSLDRMGRLRAEFSPQDFALFFLSELQDRPDLLPQAVDLRTAGARYLVANAPRLSPDLAALLPAARATLAAEAAPAPAPAPKPIPGPLPARGPRVRPARRETALRRARRRVLVALLLGCLLITLVSAGAQLLALLA